MESDLGMKSPSSPGAGRWRNLEEIGRAARGSAAAPKTAPSPVRPGSAPGAPGGPGGPGGPEWRPPGERVRRNRRTLLKWTAVVLVLAVVAVSGFFGFVLHTASTLLGKSHQKVNGLVAVGNGPTNILLVGTDSREGLSKQDLNRVETIPVAGQRTDTIILIHVSPGHKKAVMVSIPRDLKVSIPGHGTDKINAAYAVGGPDLLVRTVQQNLGVPVNHFASVDFAGFLKVVDALGGVTLCNNTGRRLDDSFANLHMAPGCQNMDGIHALAFVRARHVDSDFGRIGRQQEFLRAVMAKMTSRGNLIDVPKMLKIANIVSDHVKTDDTLKSSEAIGLARRLHSLDSNSVDMRLYPSYDPGAACSACVDYVLASPEAPVLMNAIKHDVATLPPVGLPNGQGVSLRSVRVQVLNGSGVPGLAARAAQGLQAYGLRIAGTGNAPGQTGATSTLTYPARLAQQAQLLGAVLGSQVKLVQSQGQPASDTLVLTVGSNFQVVAPPGQ
jgi:LCP family protein required for cell wall assembly